MTKVRVSLVDQGVWKMDTVSMPLSLGYIKAAAYADLGIRSATDIQICSFRGSDTASEIIHALLTQAPPDILAFSVFGWNLYRFAAVAEVYRQLRPDGWIVVGGTHVANQAERLCRLYPAIDVVVNGEGEFIFRDILQAYLGGLNKNELDHIPGSPSSAMAGRSLHPSVLGLLISTTFRLPSWRAFFRIATSTVKRSTPSPSSRLTAAVPTSVRFVTGAAPSGRKSALSRANGCVRSSIYSPGRASRALLYVTRTWGCFPETKPL